MEDKKTMNETQNNEQIQQQEEMTIVIQDRRISVPVRNQLGEQIGVFRFDPTDVNIVKRYNEASEKFAEILNGIDGEDANAFDEAGEKIIEFLDYVLGGNSREAFFAQTHPLSPQDGRFYCEQVFEMIGNFIVQKFEAESGMLNKRISTQTHGYRSGKHKKGRSQ